MEQTWIDTYYEALDFFYWEPQHLNRQRRLGKVRRSVNDMREHVRLLEVTLNHELKQLFSLAPTKLRNLVFEAAFQTTISGRFNLAGANLDAEYKLVGVMQPDFLFTGATQSIWMEMKVEAKSCTDQVLKYALLALAVEHKEPNVTKHSLVLLGKGSFSSFWKERFGSLEELRVSLEARKDSFLHERPRRLLQYKLRFDEIVSSLEIGFLSYEKLASVLGNEETNSSTEISGVYGKLLRGLLIDLTYRELVSADRAAITSLSH